MLAKLVTNEKKTQDLCGMSYLQSLFRINIFCVDHKTKFPGHFTKEIQQYTKLLGHKMSTETKLQVSERFFVLNMYYEFTRPCIS
jgi:hypothetical protein